MRKYANGRIVFRKAGRFAKACSLEEMGFDINTEERTCKSCGHVWMPVLVSGTCPKCGTEKAAV